jgi:CRISPR-associated endonuclease/helicase Cas3
LLEVPGLPELWRRLLEGMSKRQPQYELVNPHNPAAGVIIWAERRLDPGLLDEGREREAYGEDSVTENELSWPVGTAAQLEDHLRRVEQRACELARRLGLADDLVKVVSVAAQMHDLGKADPRFQLDLRGNGSFAVRYPELAQWLAPQGEPLLAKPASAVGRVRAVPDGFRHEALSVAMAQKHPAVMALPAEQQDLALWLIGTHHGYGRPFFPPCYDPAPETEARITLHEAPLDARAKEAPIRLDQGWCELAERVRRRYGPWELARLEAIVRLADHLVSAEEQEGNRT